MRCASCFVSHEQAIKPPSCGSPFPGGQFPVVEASRTASMASKASPPPPPLAPLWGAFGLRWGYRGAARQQMTSQPPHLSLYDFFGGAK